MVFFKFFKVFDFATVKLVFEPLLPNEESYWLKRKLILQTRIRNLYLVIFDFLLMNFIKIYTDAVDKRSVRYHPKDLNFADTALFTVEQFCLNGCFTGADSPTLPCVFPIRSLSVVAIFGTAFYRFVSYNQSTSLNENLKSRSFISQNFIK